MGLWRLGSDVFITPRKIVSLIKTITLTLKCGLYYVRGNVLVNLLLPITYLDKFVKLDVLCNLYTRNGTGCDAVPPFKTRIQNRNL